MGPVKPGMKTDPKADPTTVAASRPVDKEVTSLLCVYDSDDEELEKPSYFVAAGWDRRLRIWDDDTGKDENINLNRDLPKSYLASQSTKEETHGDDIMSSIYDKTNNLIFTGAHDGTL